MKKDKKLKTAKLTFILFLGFLLCSSKPMQNIVGTYYWSPIYGVHNSVELKKDSTFTFHWQAGLMLGSVNGNWNRVDDELILTSEFQDKEENNAFYKVLSATQNVYSDSLVVSLIGSQKYGFAFVSGS